MSVTVRFEMVFLVERASALLEHLPALLAQDQRSALLHTLPWKAATEIDGKLIGVNGSIGRGVLGFVQGYDPCFNTQRVDLCTEADEVLSDLANKGGAVRYLEDETGRGRVSVGVGLSIETGEVWGRLVLTSAGFAAGHALAVSPNIRSELENGARSASASALALDVDGVKMRLVVPEEREVPCGDSDEFMEYVDGKWLHDIDTYSKYVLTTWEIDSGSDSV